MEKTEVLAEEEEEPVSVPFRSPTEQDLFFLLLNDRIQDWPLEPIGSDITASIIEPLEHATNSFPSIYDQDTFDTIFGSHPTATYETTPTQTTLLPTTTPTTQTISLPTTTTTTPTTAKRKRLQSEEQTKSRAERCREASRRYRKRKRSLMEELQKKAQTLTEEKEAILKEKEKAVVLMQQLRAENEALKRKHKNDAVEVIY